MAQVSRGDRGALVDFRHVIVPVLRKPGAFINYRHREALYPSPVFRAAHDRLVSDHGERPGVIEYLQALKLAAEESVGGGEIQHGYRSALTTKPIQAGLAVALDRTARPLGKLTSTAQLCTGRLPVNLIS